MTNYSKRFDGKRLKKLSDEQLEIFLSSIFSENDLFSSVFESLQTGLIIVDTSWKVFLTNKAAERLLPFSVRKEDARRESLPLQKLLSSGDISDFLEECCKNNKSNVSDEFTVTTSSGMVRFITISVIHFVRSQELAGYVVMVNDVTEKRNQEILLHRMESLAGLTNLAASMAHEIKNPLGAIGIHVQLIQKSLKKARENGNTIPDKKFLENYLDVVNEEIENLNKKVTSFLMAVRPVNAKLELLDVTKILSETISFVAAEFENNKITVKQNLLKNPCRLLLDERLFKEVVINISQNALFALKEKFSSCNCIAEKECPGVFTIESYVKNESYILTLSDNGSGMSKETASHIFEPYFTTKASGTGLGMTFAYKVIKEFSGDIQVQSELGSGTTFVIALPLPQLDKKMLPILKKESE
ncbi:MAG: PAS domain S-box protein [Treponema sp.]|nr:PAS domain S-box protein [Treponema sp.]